MKFLTLFCFVIINITTHAQQLSTKEKSIVDIITKNIPDNLRLLENIVNINSGTLNVKGVRKVGDILAKEFKSMGFTTEWVPMPDSLKRAGHLVASLNGKRGKKLILIGHLDTVFEPDMEPGPYKRLDDSTVTGQGVKDMKGGDVIILAALKALHEAGVLNGSNITAYFTGDEEKAGKPLSVSRADFITRAKTTDIALGFEAAVNMHTVATSRRGASAWKLSVTGRQAHSGGIFNNNYGAIYEAARIINEFRVQMVGEKYLTFNPGMIAGGADINLDSSGAKASINGKDNIISPTTVVTGDLRFISNKQLENARSRMTTITTTNNLPGTSASITFEDSYPSIEPEARHDSVVNLLSRLTNEMGIGVTVSGDAAARGAGDISFVAKYVPSVDGLGASGRGPSHARGETVNLNEFPELIKRAALLIYRLTR